MSDSTCTTDGCARKIYFRGKCFAHYVRVGPRRRGTCKMDGCENVAICQKLCDMHYTRMRRHGDPAVTLRVPRDANLAERLEFTGWTEVVRRPELGPCWEWNGGKYVAGYGQVSVGGNRSKQASRMAYLAWVGPLAKDEYACHRCDNPPCMNPGHLFAGTHKENMEDCSRKDRNAYGEKSGVHKLTEAEVRYIREAYATGKFSQRELGEMHGVSQSTIGAAVRAVTWARVA